MRLFTTRQITEAVLFAKTGGQALHLHNIITHQAPACFKRAVAEGSMIAHLFDMDRQRLEQTARRLGVRVIKIDRSGTDKQHIDLCGKPLTNCWGQGLIENADERAITD